MMKSTLTALLFGSVMISPALADVERGEKLHDQQCIGCHAARFGNNGAEIYTRDNRRVQDLAGLKRQVNRCKNNLEITWFDDQVDAVVDYLNATYYHFEK